MKLLIYWHRAWKENIKLTFHAHPAADKGEVNHPHDEFRLWRWVWKN
jgi:hypothetical protein